MDAKIDQPENVSERYNDTKAENCDKELQSEKSLIGVGHIGTNIPACGGCPKHPVRNCKP